MTATVFDELKIDEAGTKVRVYTDATVQVVATRPQLTNAVAFSAREWDRMTGFVRAARQKLDRGADKG